MSETPGGLSESEKLAKVRESLLRNYFTEREYLDSELGRRDLANHLDLRLQDDRARTIPWLESFCPLTGARVLEIGCGTGASTLALAERGATVTAIDIRADSMQVAMDRCEAYGYTAKFAIANAAEVKKHFSSEKFDLIIFFAVLEHMTHEERRAAMRDTWEMLGPGGHWVVVDTPNRLWYFDGHTALLPFYHWLPDRVAFEYAKFSARDYFRELYLEHSPEKELHFLRRGRGVSFHEFDLFIAPTQDLDLVSCRHSYFRARNPQEQQDWVESGNAAYVAQLQRACPNLHPAFLEPSLDLAIRKNL